MTKPLEQIARIVDIEWPTKEEIGNHPIELMLDIRINSGLEEHFLCLEEFEGSSRSLLTCCALYEHKPWWGVIRDLSFAADCPNELEFPMYEEFEGTELSGFEFAEVIAARIGKPFERLGPFEEPINFEVWDFRERTA